MMKPCELPCPKCGSLDVNREFLIKGRESSVGLSDDKKNNKFIKTERWTQRVLQDCITNHCRCCHYEWECEPMKEDAV